MRERIDADEGAALMTAAQLGRAEVCRVLLDAGASVQIAGSYGGRSALVLATYSGDEETIRVVREASRHLAPEREVLLGAIYKDEMILRETLVSYPWLKEDLDATL